MPSSRCSHRQRHHRIARRPDDGGSGPFVQCRGYRDAHAGYTGNDAGQSNLRRCRPRSGRIFSRTIRRTDLARNQSSYHCFRSGNRLRQDDATQFTLAQRTGRVSKIGPTDLSGSFAKGSHRSNHREATIRARGRVGRGGLFSHSRWVQHKSCGFTTSPQRGTPSDCGQPSPTQTHLQAKTEYRLTTESQRTQRRLKTEIKERDEKKRKIES